MNKHQKMVFLSLLALAAILGAFIAAEGIRDSTSAQALVEQFGVFGITTIAFIAGLNLIVPIHAATFTPIFLSAGFSIVVIILAMVIGTTVADIVSYLFGRWSKHKTSIRYKTFHDRLERLKERYHVLILPGIFFYSAFAPLPNELILVPLGLMGYRFIVVIGPLVLGTLVNQTVFSFGFASIFEALF